MRLQTKAVIVLLPMVAFVIMLLGAWAIHITQNSIGKSIINSIEAELSGYVDDTLVRHHAILEENQLTEVQSFVERFQKDALRSASNLHIHYDNAGVLIFDSMGNNLLSSRDEVMEPNEKAAWSTVLELGDMDFSSDEAAKTGYIRFDGHEEIYVMRVFVPWGWRVIYTISSEQVSDSVARIRNGTIAAAAVAIIVGFSLIFVFFKQFFLRPLGALRQAALDISNHTGGKSIAIHSQDEMDDLARHMERMAENLAQSHAQQEMMNRELENKVRERTIDLDRLNKVLLEENAIRKKTEKQLRKSQALLEEAQRIADLGNWELDLVANELYWSDELFRIFGIEKGEFGASYEAFIEIVHPDDRDRLEEAYTRSVETGEPYDIVHRINRPTDGEIRYIHERCEQIRDDRGKPLRSVGTALDVTEQMLIEKSLRAAKDEADASNRAKSVFLANMSHELRTPLNAVIGFSRLVRDSEHLTEKQRESMDIINSSGIHLLRLIDDVLDIAKIEVGHVTLETAVFNLHQMLIHVMDMLRQSAEDKQLNLSFEKEPGLPEYIIGDEMKMQRILLNLLGNAIKFTDAGDVVLYAGCSDRDQDGHFHLRFSVQDQGRGIPEEDKERIFEPFVQLGFQAGRGTGLGLAIIRQYLDIMEGTITLESLPGEGCRFDVEIPSQVTVGGDGQEVNRPPRKVIGLEPGQPVCRQMIVEDQRENSLLLQRILERFNFEIRAVENGVEAVELFSEWRPDLIWMDRRMPIMDGLEATRKIRVMPGGEDVKIVAITASVLNEMQDEIMSAGFDTVVHKPYRNEDIYSCLEEQLGLRFIYDSSEVEEGEGESELDPSLLDEVPSNLFESLRQAVLALDTEKILAVAEKIEPISSDLATAIRHEVESFDITSLMKFLEKRSSAGDSGARDI
ncbi:MAG: ATP-binding protein, partial [Sedimenticola sp.]